MLLSRRSPCDVFTRVCVIRLCVVSSSTAAETNAPKADRRCREEKGALYIRSSDVTESIVTKLSPFCGHNMT